jgi:hypothetical protein
MLKKLLPSFSANNLITSGKTETHGRGWRIASTAIGILVVLIGAADVSSRVAHAVFGNNASMYSFAPAVSLIGNYNKTTSETGTIPAVV